MAVTVLKNASVLRDNQTVDTTDIVIDGDSIASIGAVAADFQCDEIIDCTGQFAAPGFVNTHTHAAMTLLRGYADDMNLMDWLQNKIWPIEAKMSVNDIYWGTMLAIVEMIKSGTTTFADMYASMDKVGDAAIETGMRAVLARGIIGVNSNAQEALAENVELFKNYHQAAGGLTTVMFAPHAPYTCPPDFMRQVVDVAKKYGADIHTHVAETKGEVDDCFKQYGKSPVALLEEAGVFDVGVLAAHCVHVSADDIAIMRRHSVRVAHNPGSNMKLASGIAPVTAMLDAGLCVALGTDGASSNNNLDMLEEMRLAGLLHKVNLLNPLAVPALTALKMATEYGAAALGLEKVGRLTPGYKADITLFNIDGAHWHPQFDMVALLVYSANAADVDTVFINGKKVMQGRRLLTLDEERVIYEANRRAMVLSNEK